MIKKRLGKISKLLFLIGVRQGWLLVVNVYRLLHNPYLAIKEIRDEKDKSQTALIAGAAVLPAIIYIGARIIWDYYIYGTLIDTVGRAFWGVVMIEILIFVYLGYWTWRVVKEGK